MLPQQTCHNLLTALRSALRSESGAVLPIFAISLVAMFGTIAAAVDFGLAYSHHGKMQKSADAAALAAAKMIDATVSERQTRAANIFAANYADSAQAAVSLEVVGKNANSPGAVLLTVNRPITTNILPLFGYSTINITTQTHVPIPRLLDTEVVLVLDYSDSMLSNQKYVRMREAAFQLVDTISLQATNANARFGVVPFAAMVKADLPAYAIRGDVSYSGCTQDRRSPFNAEETAPTLTNDSKWGEVTSAHNCAEMGTANLRTVPLTNDFTGIKNKISAMYPYMWTHIAAGAEMGWQVISPTGVFGGAAPYDPDKTIKVAIILTDGSQTAPGWGSDGTKTTAHAEANLLDLCQGMKQKGIRVFTVGYDLPDVHTKNLLQMCAGPNQFYDAADIQTGLKTAFSEIGDRVQASMIRLID